MENLISNLTTISNFMQPFWVLINLAIVLYIIWQLRIMKAVTQEAAMQLILEAVAQEAAEELKTVARETAEELKTVAREIAEELKTVAKQVAKTLK